MKLCPNGKILNLKTNRCNTIKCPKSQIIDKYTINCVTKTCPSGKVINPKTGRCIIDRTKLTKIKTCPSGKVINPKTGRCIIDRTISKKNLSLSKTNTTINKTKKKKIKFIVKKKSKKPKANTSDSLKNSNSRLVSKIKVKKTTFRGVSSIIFYGMLYLLQKYKNIAYPISKKIWKNFSIFNEYQTAISFTCKPPTNKTKFNVRNDFILKFPAVYPNEANFFSLITKYENNPKIDYVICGLGVDHDCLDKNGHYNMIIFDLNRKEVERFEPHGVISSKLQDSIYNELDYQFENVFRKHKYKYLPPNTFCPYIGPQKKETMYDGLRLKQNIKTQLSTSMSNTDTILPTDPGGFCAAWSLWYADIRMRNPKVHKNKLIKKAIELINKKPMKFRQFIRNYAEFIVQQQNKLKYKVNSLLDFNKLSIIHPTTTMKLKGTQRHN